MEVGYIAGKDGPEAKCTDLELNQLVSIDDRAGPVARSVFAMALNAVLFQDLLRASAVLILIHGLGMPGHQSDSATLKSE